MSLARQLHDLQETDLALRSNEQAQARTGSQLGESREIARVKTRLADEKDRLEELTHQQHSLEWEVDDLSIKVASIEEKLFGGRIHNPKELANLQRENEEVKARQSQLEDRVLELMDQAETTTTAVQTSTAELVRMEEEWRDQQQRLATELAQLKDSHADLTQKRAVQVAQIESATIEIYQQLQAQKGTAVARVEQGTCRGCQITLPTTELQQVRGGGLVRCSNCGRILYLA
jgi:predicted  nucleic acid-binding Zn-ribbon protein